MSLYLRVGAAAAVSEDDGVVRQHLPSLSLSSDEGSRDGGGCVCRQCLLLLLLFLWLVGIVGVV